MVCCSGVAVCCSALQCVAGNSVAHTLVPMILVTMLRDRHIPEAVSAVAVCCSVLQCGAVCCSMLCCVAVCCSLSLQGGEDP